MTTFALNNLWAYLQGLSLSQNDREWLANKLIMPKETNLVEDDNARLDEALAKFSGDFGGSADAMTVAEELRPHAVCSSIEAECYFANSFSISSSI